MRYPAPEGTARGSEAAKSGVEDPARSPSRSSPYDRFAHPSGLGDLVRLPRSEGVSTLGPEATRPDTGTPLTMAGSGFKAPFDHRLTCVYLNLAQWAKHSGWLILPEIDPELLHLLLSIIEQPMGCASSRTTR